MSGGRYRPRRESKVLHSPVYFARRETSDVPCRLLLNDDFLPLNYGLPILVLFGSLLLELVARQRIGLGRDLHTIEFLNRLRILVDLAQLCDQPVGDRVGRFRGARKPNQPSQPAFLMPLSVRVGTSG